MFSEERNQVKSKISVSTGVAPCGPLHITGSRKRNIRRRVYFLYTVCEIYANLNIFAYIGKHNSNHEL